MRKNGGVETTIPHNSSLLWRWSQPNTFTTPCFPGVGGVELKKHGVGGVELFL